MMDQYRENNPDVIEIPDSEYQKMEEIAKNNAIGVYSANMALVGYSNAKMMKKYIWC